VGFRRPVPAERRADEADGTWERTPTPPGWTDSLKGTLRVRALDDIYAYTPRMPGGRISHWDGSAWTDLPAPPEEAMVVITNDGVWAFLNPALEDKNKVLRFENGAWQEAAKPSVYGNNLHAYEHDGALYLQMMVCSYCPITGELPHGPISYPFFRWNGSGWDDVTVPGDAPSGYERGWKLPGGGLLATGENWLGFTAATTVPAS
jgi:hypothetical protein